MPVHLCYSLNSTPAKQDYVKESIKYINKASSKVEQYKWRLHKANTVYARKLNRKQNKFLAALSKVNKTDAAGLEQKLNQSASFYKHQNQKNKSTGNISLTTYIPYYDTLKTTIRFYETQSSLEVTEELCNAIQNASVQLAALDSELADAQMLNKQFATVQKRFTQAVIKHPALENNLEGFNKQFYYFNAQVGEYTRLFTDKGNYEALFLNTIKNFIPGLNESVNSNLAINKALVNPYSQNINAAGVQTNDIVKQAEANAFSAITDNGNNLKSTLLPRFQKVNDLRKYKADVSIGKNFKMNPYKTKRFVDRLEKSISFRPYFSDYYRNFSISFFFQLGYKINLRSTAGFGFSTLNSVASAHAVRDYKNSTGHIDSHLFFDYWLFSIIHAYGEYKPWVYIPDNSFENAPVVRRKAPSNKDITVGIRIKPFTFKKSSTNIYLLYTIPPHKAPYFQYRIGINF